MPKWTHPIFTANNNSQDGPAGCFCSLGAEPPMQHPCPSTNSSSRHQPHAASSRRASQLLSVTGNMDPSPVSSLTPECLGVVYRGVRQRQFLCYQTVSISEGSSTRLSAAKAAAKLLAMPLDISSRKIFSPGFSDLLSAFLRVDNVSSSTQQGGQDPCGSISSGAIWWQCRDPRDQAPS